MKKVFIISSLVIIAMILGLIINNIPNDEANLDSKLLVKQENAKLSDEIKKVNGQLIDVREPSEYLESHANQAINIPLGEILKSDFSKIDNTRPIYLICRSGRRAEEAKLFLEKAGFMNVKNIGGLIDWTNQGDTACSSSTPTCS